MSAHATGIEKGTEAVSSGKLTGLRFPEAAAPVPSQEKQGVNPTVDPLRPPSVVSPEAGTSEDDDEEEDDDGYPEGGLNAWLVVFGCWLALFSSLGLMNTLATFQAYVSTHQLQDHSEGQIGWIFSIYTFLTFFCGIYIGPIFDKYGPKWLVLAGTILLVVSLVLLSFSTQYWHFLVSFGILSGFASSLLFTPSIAAVGHFFKKRRGLATGIASTGGSVGGVIFPLMLTSLFERIGWAWAVRVQALISFTLCAASNFLIRSRLPPAKNAKVHPDFLIFRDVTMLLTTIGIFLLEFALFIPLTYITSYMLASGFDESFAFNTLAIFNAASVFGRALPGYWGDKFGPFNSNMGATLLSVFGAFVVWLPFGTTTPGVIMFAILIGFASGNNISISPVCIGRLCHTKHYGRYYATSYTVVAVACLVSIPIGGEILAATGGSYWALIVFTGLLYAASFVVLLAAKISYVGWKPLAIF